MGYPARLTAGGRAGIRKFSLVEAVQNVGPNAISTTLSFENRRYIRCPEVAVRVDSTFWTASTDASALRQVASLLPE